MVEKRRWGSLAATGLLPPIAFLMPLFLLAAVWAAPPGSEEDPLVTRSYVQLRVAEGLTPLANQVADLSARVVSLERRVAALKEGYRLEVALTIGHRIAYIGVYPRTLEVAPFINSAGRTMLPFRFIGEALGAQVGWDGNTRTVSYRLGSKHLFLQIGSTTAYLNGQAVNLDSAPQLVNNRTVVPLRLVSELLGARVDWDDASRRVTVYP